MLIPLLTLFLVTSIAWLAIGVKGRKETALLALNVFWWLGAFISAYFVWLTWQERAYSENWAAAGLLVFLLSQMITGILSA